MPWVIFGVALGVSTHNLGLSHTLVGMLPRLGVGIEHSPETTVRRASSPRRHFLRAIRLQPLSRPWLIHQRSVRIFSPRTETEKPKAKLGKGARTV